MNLCLEKAAVSRLAEELRTELLGQIPLGQPDWDEEDFAPSVYAESIRLERFTRILPKGLLKKTNK